MDDLQFCKFCGQHLDAPCVDETDLHIYSCTIGRCSDAAFNYEGERHFEELASSHSRPHQPGETS